MPHSHRTRRINPRLGTYFGIFVAGFLALGILALIAEKNPAAPPPMIATLMEHKAMTYGRIHSPKGQ